MARKSTTEDNRRAFEKSMSILATPDVQQRIDVACIAAGDTVRSFLSEWVQEYGHKRVPFESPLEAIFFAWWWAFELCHSVAFFDDIDGPKLNLAPQEEVECDGVTYRLDFRVYPYTKLLAEFERRADFPLIAIELDGHDYHEKTKEQVTYRNARDRALQARGWRVFHVSGSELARRPKEVVDELHRHCRNEYAAFRRAQYATDAKLPTSS